MAVSASAKLFEDDIHPRILLGPEDLPALRARVQRGLPGRAWAELQRRCAELCDPASPRYADPEVRGRAVPAAPVASLAFAAVLDEQGPWKDHALRLMRAVVREGIGDMHGHSPLPPESLPLAYDLLHGAMEAEDRRRTAAFIRERLETFQRAIVDQPRKWIWLLGTNPTLAWVHYYPFWLAAVYEPQRDGPAMRQFAQMLRRSLHLGIDQGGAIGEGPNYGLHDALRWTVPAEILRRAGVADLWQEEPRLLAMLRFWGYLLLPGRREINPIQDSRRNHGSNPLFSHLLGARRSGDPVIQWIWETLGGRGPLAELGEAPERFTSGLEKVILWEDDQAAVHGPGTAGWPTAVSSGDYGVNVIRSGWDDQALYFSLLASGRTPGCVIHQHLDGGHFSLFALGEAFSIDTGYGDSRGKHHSVMMPDGKEPPAAPLHFDNVYPGGRTEAFVHGRQADYCRVNISWQWDCHWNYRHALVVRAPGAYPYVLLLDNVNYRASYGFYDWLMQTEPGNRIELDEANLRATVHGRQHRLELAWALPGGEDFPVAPRMELASDEIDSHPLDHVKPGLRLGIGRHPRLKATLWAHSGVALTALVPRRADEPPARVTRLVGPMHFGLRIDHGPVVDTVVASPFDRHLDLAGLEGEASLALVRRDAAGAIQWCAAADAFSFAVDGQPKLPPQGQPVTLWESA